MNTLLRTAKPHTSIEKFLKSCWAIAIQIHDSVQGGRWNIEIDSKRCHDIMRFVVLHQQSNLLSRHNPIGIDVGLLEERLQRQAELLRLSNERTKFNFLLRRIMNDTLHDDTYHQVDQGKVSESDHCDEVKCPQRALLHGCAGDVRPAFEGHHTEVCKKSVAERSEVETNFLIVFICLPDEDHANHRTCVDDHAQKQRHPPNGTDGVS
mmetsp:Transcript_80349/g.126750  ORF Transcript_80349/g.126750 Transcript_80349/m.126750 type:complete len:208 (+) Transcript_80349:610-1233(+)